MSSHRLFAGRQYAGREYIPSLFTGVGDFVAQLLPRTCFHLNFVRTTHYLDFLRRTTHEIDFQRRTEFDFEFGCTDDVED